MTSVLGTMDLKTLKFEVEDFCFIVFSFMCAMVIGFGVFLGFLCSKI